MTKRAREFMTKWNSVDQLSQLASEIIDAEKVSTLYLTRDGNEDGPRVSFALLNVIELAVLAAFEAGETKA